MKKRNEKRLSILMAALVALSLFTPIYAADKSTLDKAVNDAAEYVLKTVKNPVVDSVGGEWVVIGLARSGYSVPDSYYENYYKNVEKYVKDKKGVLHDIKYTEYSRVILGLTAAGYDPRDVAGYDLTAPLSDFEKTVWQGINGPIFALISLDSRDYPNSRRDDYISEILRRQLNDGGWNLTGGMSADTKNQTADPDITGMALQALAKYQGKPEVKAATDKALACLSGTQDLKGGFSGNFSVDTPAIESTVQVLVALCELGIPVDDPRFVKNGNTLTDNILSYKNTDGSFKHSVGGSGNSQMSSEQALYALVAAQRAADGRNSLYRMGDTAKRGDYTSVVTFGLPGKHADVQEIPVSLPGKTFDDINGHKSRTAIEALASRSIITGRSETSFDPDATMTRAEFSAIVTRSLGLTAKDAFAFSDVPASAWYSNPVGIAYNYKIVNGVSETAFNPSGTITRQEAAVMVARAAKLCGMDTALIDVEIRDTLAQFGDYKSVADWAVGPVAFCYSEGILDDSMIDISPGQPIKRCEIAEMLYRMLEGARLL